MVGVQAKLYPSMYSAVTGVSLGALFLAGVIPGLLLGLSQMLIVAYLSRKRGWLPYAAFSLEEVWRSGRRAISSWSERASVNSALSSQ